MKKIIFWGTSLLILVIINYMIIQKEATISNGRTMLLSLAPVDPRSIMQGDYMVLRYALAAKTGRLENEGNIVVSLDKNNVAKFIRLHNDEQLKEGEYLLFYRNRKGLRLGAESFLFQEGHGYIYSKAKYGELKVDNSGKSVLIGLRDGKFKSLGANHK